MWYMHNVGAGWWVLMSLGMVAFWAVVVWAIWVVVRGSHRDGESSQSDSPLEIIKRRLARGEISGAEYDELRKKLESRPPAPA